MGLFDFLKNAGRKVEPEPRPEVTKEQFDEAREKGREAAIVKLITGLRLDIENLIVDVEGETVTLRGNAKTQADREKAILAAGNISGIAHVDDRMTTMGAAAAPGTTPAAGTVRASTGSPAEAQSAFYTVEKGDTLSKIAKQHYGNANRYNEIFEANRPMLKDADEIYPGQVLRIPGATAQATTAGVKA
jgi:nucleoid-associated protein YgaU